MSAPESRPTAAVPPLLDLLASGPPVNTAEVARHLHSLGYQAVGSAGKARSWKHPESPAVLTFWEQPTGMIVWSGEVKKIHRHVCKVLELSGKEGADEQPDD